MIERTEYLNKLKQLKDKRIIKVITGVRRCGKSVLMGQFRNFLLENGVKENQIYFANFEERKNIDLLKWEELHDEIEKRLLKNKMNYIFLDEIQRVEGWEKMVDSLFVKENVDIYITGSNAYFLSSEFSTFLAGRQFEIKMLPFSYKEYLSAAAVENSEKVFLAYLRFGGMPQSVEMFKESEELGLEYLSGVYNTVVIKDMLGRPGAPDAEIFERILRYVIDNIGNAFSAKKVADYLSANYRAVSSRTVDQALMIAVESLILYRTERFDIRGKEILKTQQKYYLVDNGFRNVILGRGAEFDLGRMLENVVYLELKRRGYQIWVGKTGRGREVDFIARTQKGTIEYYQVTESMRSEETRKRKLESLQNISDNCDKTIICLDSEENNYDGIKQRNVIDWLS